jgi:hypothetical protein
MAKPIKNDLIFGYQAIADYMGITLRQAEYMGEKKHPAIQKAPGMGIHARKSELDRIGLISSQHAAE